MAERKIHFYRAIDDAGRLRRDFPADAVVQLLRREVKAGRAEVESRGGRYLLAEPFRTPRGADGHFLALYNVSSEDLPMLYNRKTRTITPLEDAIAGGDIAEPTYFGFYRAGILAFVYNQRGPTPKALAIYLNGLLLDLNAEFAPVPRMDVLQAVEEAGGIKLLDLRIPLESADFLSQIPSIAAARSLLDNTRAGSIEIILRARTDVERTNMARRVQEIAPLLVGSRAREALERAKVELADRDVYSGDRPLDLLADSIVLEREVETVPGRRRHLQPQDALRAIDDAYREVQHILEAQA